MVGKRTARPKASQLPSSVRTDVPDVFQEMLAEVLPSQLNNVPSKMIKRRRTGNGKSSDCLDTVDDLNAKTETENGRSHIKDKKIERNIDRIKGKIDGDLNLKGLISGVTRSSSDRKEADGYQSHLKKEQTSYRDSSESSEESGCEWESVNFDTKYDDPIDDMPGSTASGDLELTLTRTLASQEKRTLSRRNNNTKEERLARLLVHKLHILCLLSYLDRRNDWCNDIEVQASLNPFLTPHLRKLLKPRPQLSQFSRTQSLKQGLSELSVLWKTQFSITERGMRRALWADDHESLNLSKVPDDIDSVFDKNGFRKAASAKKLKGSRDVGAQLFCALLRSAGVETRLVCSLQPLSFKAGGPLRNVKPLSQSSETVKVNSLDSDDKEIPKFLLPNKTESTRFKPGSFTLQPQRLGHPNAADYHMPKMRSPQPKPIRKIVKAKIIQESSYPVFWTEVFDDAHQKWIPVDPIVTQITAKTRGFEPPASDLDNNMSYVIAFDKEGNAKDVTRRYVKAYNSKTRKIRVESTNGGQKWWNKIMRSFSREYSSNADKAEDLELASLEAQEPMPKNIADFKGHSYFVLERHLRRNEVLVRNQECGRISVGRNLSLTGSKKVELVYRRRDVQIAKSADSWYKLGREVKPGEQPVKVVQPRISSEADDKRLATPRGNNYLYLEEQTDLYQAPPIVNGRVPKNSFGNIDIFVPSMLPQGAVHLPNTEASTAAKILGIDYADALTGFKFRGRHGTAILSGIVFAKEYEDAVLAVIDGLEGEKLEAGERFRAQAALRMWKQLVVALRIKARIDSYQLEGESSDTSRDQHVSTKLPNDMQIDNKK